MFRAGRNFNFLSMAMVALCCLYSSDSVAHKLAPSLLQLDESAVGVYQVVWRTPMYSPKFPEPVLPETCRKGDLSTAAVGSAIEQRWVANCGSSLDGKELAVASLGESRTVAMLRFKPLKGKLQQRILTPEAPSYVVPVGHASKSVWGEYIDLGIEHILVGTDHLLFVTALLLLSGSLRVLLKTVTAFTLGHSVTLALVSLELIPHWPALAEFLIATTILILALELSRPLADDGRHYIRRYQWVMASGFGLVHGLGFANVLRDIGIPSSELIPALLPFNIGIEIGQLIFVGAAASLLYAIQHRSAPSYRIVRAVIILAMGGISVYWCLDRGAAMMTSLL